MLPLFLRQQPVHWSVRQRLRKTTCQPWWIALSCCDMLRCRENSSQWSTSLKWGAVDIARTLENMKYQINKAVVIGSGTMGAAIAAHLANTGIQTSLLDIIPRDLTEDEKSKGLSLDDPAVRNRIVNQGFQAVIHITFGIWFCIRWYRKARDG